MRMIVLHPGAFTTVQDLGRRGHRAVGVSPGGAVDAVALRLANLAVGNDESAAGLECTLVGPRVKFSADAVIAVGGARVDGIESLRPIRVSRGQVLSLEQIVEGCRAYLAIAGGIDVPVILGGRGTDVRGGFGGLGGRALRKGDELPIGRAAAGAPAGSRINAAAIVRYSNQPILRVLRGSHAEEFDRFIEEVEFRVAAQSDRTGARLIGPELARRESVERLSFAVAPGAVQVPPSGQPIVLLADAPTIGGYPVIAHVIAADLPLVAQLRPGDTMRFRLVTLPEAHQALREQERALAVVRQRLRL